jgi:TolA-binding protein
LEAFYQATARSFPRFGEYCCCIAAATTQFHTVQMQSQSLREIEDMSEANVANQKKILSNQATIIANQKQIKANQETIKKNQGVILKNQATLNTIVANQKKILSKLK